ncbi:Phage terminase-like protein, large subunit, contains N-terminal HTH domain [Virgibacillus subterraneus]|uniref:Phage terminase-like protein, large subunit, contains N-terminal HTH domain n=1 Tax=Virgibacillus subterraneus TaxID=621109 RepID=A0A1H9ECC7_9BACI|nr:terminase TerL endonuclease subunit [Virgibacillus subterraneus]SEQ23404.1 Phage terminase-like protein, large subunit, contains N-terminal HTH domain [Virgibacillus subterraneus]
MKINKHVKFYMNQYESGKIKVSKYVVLLFGYLKKYILNRDDIYFDEVTHERYIAFTEKNYFKLMPFQKFITAFVFLYYKEGDYPFYEQFFWYKARGAGKNGLISSLTNFFISDLHGINNYNVSIVANSEEQAKTSFNEIFNVIDLNGKGGVLQSLFKHTKSEIKSKTNSSVLKYHTSNAKTKDSLRDGCVVYDEVHEYEDSTIVDVFSSGLGKVKHSREFFITTDGFVRGGYLDDLKERAIRVLKGDSLEDPLFVFMATLDDEKEMEDESNWQKANPMFHEPMGEYGKELFRKVRTQYISLKNSKPSARIRFMTKRMNTPATDLTSSVATWEEVEATNRPFPELAHRTAVGGLDFASIRDFASVGLLFKVGDDYVWKTHSFVRQGFLDSVELKPPIKDWESDGFLTIVDEPVINISHIVDWFVEMREIYGVNRIVADTFRLDLVKAALEAEGFQLIYIRNPKAIHSKLAPRVETIFANHNIIFDDNPLMRWFTNNVYVKIKKDGNKEYLKKDEVRRKTDGFQAFIHALFEADNVLEEEEEFYLDEIAF